MCLTSFANTMFTVRIVVYSCRLPLLLSWPYLFIHSIPDLHFQFLIGTIPYNAVLNVRSQSINP